METDITDSTNYQEFQGEICDISYNAVRNDKRTKWQRVE